MCDVVTYIINLILIVILRRVWIGFTYEMRDLDDDLNNKRSDDRKIES